MRCSTGGCDWKVNFGQSKIKAMNGNPKLDTFSGSWKMRKNKGGKAKNKISL